MRWLLIAAIRLYQRFLRPRISRVCIFRESCSRRVVRAAREEGFVAALGQLWQRMRQCRPGHRPLELRSVVGERLFFLADMSVVEARFLSSRALNEFPEKGS